MALLPFRVLPASWGLVGDAYLEAKAHYDLTGEALERRLLEIRIKDADELRRKLLDVDLAYRHITPYDHAKYVAGLDCTDKTALKLRLLAIDAEFCVISDYDASRGEAELLHGPGVERDLALLDIDHQCHRISNHDYEKTKATLREEPWIAIVNSGFNPDQGIDGVFFEFDWNKHWIEFLRLNGYVGHTDEQIVDDWFTDVCKSYTNADLSSSPFPNELGSIP